MAAELEQQLANQADTAVTSLGIELNAELGIG